MRLARWVWDRPRVIETSLTFLGAFMWTVRRLTRIQEETRAEVRAHLGRDPTPDEVFEYLQAKER